MMAQEDFTAAVRFQTAAFVLVAALIFVGGSLEGFSQAPAQTNDLLPKESVKETVVEPVNASPIIKSPGDIKVIFDETASGVVYIVSNGEKIRVGTTKKNVEQVTTDSSIANNEVLKEEQPGKVEPPINQKVESVYDFDSGEEPYDYRLINVPTPKKVPKGSLNLSFSHRFSQPIHPIKESGRNLLGFDSFSVSSFVLTYGITDKLYVSASRSPLCQTGLCRTIELGVGYHRLDQNARSPFALNT